MMKLADLQTRLSDLVKTSPLLKDRPVLIEDKGNLVADLDLALQKQSLAVVVALSGGRAKEGTPTGRAASNETFEIVIHRGLLDGDDVPATMAVLDELIPKINGAKAKEDNAAAGFFKYVGHDLREGGDGTYARVLEIAYTRTISSAP